MKKYDKWPNPVRFTLVLIKLDIIDRATGIWLLSEYWGYKHGSKVSF